MALVILPDGTLLVTGGPSGPGDNSPDTAVLSAELWKPATDTWTMLTSGTVARLYHCAALLLPDGRGIAIGGEHIADAVEPDIEIFWPPDLFKGARPTMTREPAQVPCGQRFRCESAEAGGIGKVNPADVGHAQRGPAPEPAVVHAGSGRFGHHITASASANLAPPGFYLAVPGRCQRRAVGWPHRAACATASQTEVGRRAPVDRSTSWIHWRVGKTTADGR